MIHHKPVLLEETIRMLNVQEYGIYVDCTFGNGGHSKKILSLLGNEGKLIAIDRDPYAIKIANEIKDDRLIVIHDVFSRTFKHISSLGFVGKIDGILLDLGVSSTQLKSRNRGFSFKKDGPLDMRMNQNDTMSAAKWIQHAKKQEIVQVLKNFGEVRYAYKIANSIFSYNKKKRITHTLELADIISKTIQTKKHQRIHPATRSFMAIRIFINNELEEIKMFLNQVLHILKPSGTLAIISFHSLEDKIIKSFILQHSKLNNKSRPNFILKNTKKIFPSIKEIQNNISSRSAILRTAEKHCI